MNNWIENLKQYHYTSGLIVNFIVFAIIYKLFGFNWFMVVFAADLTRDAGAIVMKLFNDKPTPSKENPNEQRHRTSI